MASVAPKASPPSLDLFYPSFRSALKSQARIQDGTALCVDQAAGPAQGRPRSSPSPLPCGGLSIAELAAPQQLQRRTRRHANQNRPVRDQLPHSSNGALQQAETECRTAHKTQHLAVRLTEFMLVCQCRRKVRRVSACATIRPTPSADGVGAALTTSRRAPALRVATLLPRCASVSSLLSRSFSDLAPCALLLDVRLTYWLLLFLLMQYTVNWSQKALRRRTTGTGRMRHLKNVQRKFKNGFREGSSAVSKKAATN